MKSIAAGLLSKATSGEISPFMILDFEVPSGEVTRYTDCDIDLMYRGNRYVSRGFQVEPLSYTLDRYADQCVVEVDAVDQTLFTTFVGNSSYGLPINVRYVLVDNYGNLLPRGEDFERLYDIYDPNSKLTINDSQIIFTDVERNEDTWVVYDFGVDYFDGDFDHYKELFIDSASSSGGTAYVWGLANTVNNFQNIDVANGDYLGVYATCGPTSYLIYGQECNAGSLTSSSVSGLSFDTTYYLHIKRDESVGTYGTLYCYIYSDEGRTTLVDTLSVVLTEKQDFQYLYPFNSYNSGHALGISGRVSNLVLDGGAGGIAIPWFNGEIDDVEIDVDDRIKITGATMFSRWRTNTINRHSPSCRYKIFKGEDCGYSGEGTSCDRTKARCLALGNELNFGGYEWLPSIVDTEIWWGGEPGYVES